MLNAYCGPLENTAAFTRGANTNAPAARADVTNPVANPALSGAYGATCTDNPYPNPLANPNMSPYPTYSGHTARNCIANDAVHNPHAANAPANAATRETPYVAYTHGPATDIALTVAMVLSENTLDSIARPTPNPCSRGTRYIDQQNSVPSPRFSANAPAYPNHRSAVVALAAAARAASSPSPKSSPSVSYPSHDALYIARHVVLVVEHHPPRVPSPRRVLLVVVAPSPPVLVVFSSSLPRVERPIVVHARALDDDDDDDAFDAVPHRLRATVAVARATVAIARGRGLASTKTVGRSPWEGGRTSPWRAYDQSRPATCGGTHQTYGVREDSRISTGGGYT
jgi:hypothetical protein